MVILFFFIFIFPVFIGPPSIFSQDVPDPTETPINTPTPTISPTAPPTLIITQTPTPTTNPTIINPDLGIKFTEFMPYSYLEWVEIYNDNDKSVELKGWKIKNASSQTKIIPNIKISSKSYKIFEFSNFLNNGSDKIILLSHDDKLIGQHEYPDKKNTLERSWSYINGSWCQAEITQNKPNASSCYSASPTIPTPTVNIINSPTSTVPITPSSLPTDKNLYQPDETATASAVFTPIEENISQTTPTIEPNSITSNLVLGQTTTAKKNYLPLIFIVFGGLFLTFPLIIDKLKKK